jgi:hypothetical protein
MSTGIRQEASMAPVRLASSSLGLIKAVDKETEPVITLNS